MKDYNGVEIDTDKYLDIPFSEADCYQFGSILYKDIKGYALPTFDYSLDNTTSMVRAVMSGEDIFTPIAKEDLQLLDGIIFTSVECKRHIGFYLEKGKFIHQVMGSFPAIESINSPKWSNRILGYCRYEP